MSEQKPENGFTSSKILNKELNDKVQNVKKSIVSTLFKIIIALAIIVFSIWFTNSKYLFGSSEVLRTAILSTSVFVAGIVLIWGNFARLLIYFKNSVVELKKVVWPDKAYATKMTIFVLIFVTILTIFIYLADFLISWVLFDLLMKKG
ncbi:preprotein translocase subunit SecE [Neisseria elongata]|jgi:preprotein translocase, secE subunit|uniref:preprotein translocase subunit SecE n=1 Tax=Neisseria elongata TaxID=495 RepID=UPI0009F4DD75|nr:preprotein translocase subunit SecE [Neisseria elongata]